MPILLVPLLILGVAYASSLAARARIAEARHPTAVAGLLPATVHVAGEWQPPASRTRAPSPLVVLDQYLRAGQRPPPPVVLCAIAEAEVLGRPDVARELVEAFVRPVVDAADSAAAARAVRVSPPGAWPPPQASAPQLPTWPEQPGQPGQAPDPRPVQGDDLPDWLLPGGGQASTSRPRAIGRPEDARVQILGPQTPPVAIRASTMLDYPTSDSSLESAAPSTITVSGRSSPIEGVAADNWAEFASRVAREQPAFSSNHHVGQYRQRRSRLAELGIDPDSIVGSTDGQASALEADMRDAYQHAHSSGLLAEFRGAVVEVPQDDGRSAPIEVTLSGVLGVIQAAGLEGAVGWLEDPSDRRRFAGTTQAFRRTNGVF